MKIVNSFLRLKLFHHLENILRKRIVQVLQGYKDFVCRNIIPHSRCSSTIKLILTHSLSLAHLFPKSRRNEIITKLKLVYIPCLYHAVPLLETSRNQRRNGRWYLFNRSYLSCKNEWPENCNQLRKPLQDYWKLRSELTCAYVDNLLLITNIIFFFKILHPKFWDTFM